MLDWKYFPHIFDCIYNNLDGQGLEVVRMTCSRLRSRAEKDLWESVTMTHKTLFSSSPDTVPQPEAVLLTKTQLYSSRFHTPLPRAHENGHAEITKVVNVSHPPVLRCQYNGAEEWEDPGQCPVARHVLAIDRKMGCDVVVQLLQVDTYSCEDTDDAFDHTNCEALISSQLLWSAHEQSDENYIYPLPAAEHIFKLTYPTRSGVAPLQVTSSNIYGPYDITIILVPERTEHSLLNRGNELEGSYNPGLFLEAVAEAADGHLCSRITFVAVDTWPPEGSPALPTPQTSNAAFADGYKDCLERRVTGIDRVEVISWAEMRQRFGDTVCNVVMSDSALPSSIRDVHPPWVSYFSQAIAFGFTGYRQLHITLPPSITYPSPNSPRHRPPPRDSPCTPLLLSVRTPRRRHVA